VLPGPVFAFELMATARHGRFYLLRSFYAAVLLVILWTVHSAWVSETGSELSSAMVKWFALSALCSIAAGQEILALALTPALAAGVIADELWSFASRKESTLSTACFTVFVLARIARPGYHSDPYVKSEHVNSHVLFAKIKVGESRAARLGVDNARDSAR